MSATGDGQSILVADDEPGFRDLFRFTLEPLGYEVVAVESGTRAIEAFRQRPFDLVILDVHMPLGGHHALKSMREMRPEARVLVFSSTAGQRDSFAAEVLELGAVACIFKPIELDVLLQEIECALARPRQGGV